jgi:sugar phosphate permease
MREAIAIIIGIAIGIATNLVSGFITPLAEKRKRTVVSIFVALLALSVMLVLFPVPTE